MHPKISVVVPTYNCAPLMERHLEAVAKWSDLAYEIIVVDSRSSDGTLELIRARLRHPKLRIIERDRGLYESWNEGIAATTGDWIYISTAGDTIEREHLVHLRDLGERAKADVIISSPRFVDESGVPCKDPGWPPGVIIASSGRVEPFIPTPEASFMLAFMHFPSAILGSSASNLYRGEHLRARPFPTGFKGAGDSVWILKHAAQSRLCFTPQVGSTFCIHPKDDEAHGERLRKLQAELVNEKKRSLLQAGADVEIVRELRAHQQLLGEVQAIQHKRRSIWRGRPIAAASLCSWLGLTFQYLKKRADLKSRTRQFNRSPLARTRYLGVSDMAERKP